MVENGPSTRGRSVTRVVLVGVNGLLAMCCLAIALVTDLPWQGRIVVGLLGVLWLTWLPLAWRAWSTAAVDPGSGRDRVFSTPDPGAASVVAYDARGMRGGAWVTGGLSSVVLLAMVLGIAAGNGGAAVLLGAPFLLLFGLAFLDLLLAAGRTAQVRLTTTGVDVQGWRTTASLDWEAVAGVDVEVIQGRSYYRVRELASGGSWRGRHLRRAWPTKDPLRVGELLIPVGDLGSNGPLLLRTIQRAAKDPAARTRLGTDAGTAMLLDPTLT